MKVKASKKIKPIIYYLALASLCLSLCACNPNLYPKNTVNTNLITNSINIDDYRIDYDDIESDYILYKNKGDKPYEYKPSYSKLYLESAVYVSSNPSQYGYNPIDLDELNKYSVYYINPENNWIEPYLNDKRYTCKDIAIEQYKDEDGEEYILYKCAVYVVNDFDQGKTIELSGKVWPIQEIAYEVPVSPVESFYVYYTSLSKLDEKGYAHLLADKEEGFDRVSVNGNLDDILLQKQNIKIK
ncbi:MAG: hypothetical protein IKP76_01535 [Bacilli bacterium]|nr:hypothetical protein [Bacilli bacterium]